MKKNIKNEFKLSYFFFIGLSLVFTTHSSAQTQNRLLSPLKNFQNEVNRIYLDQSNIYFGGQENWSVLNLNADDVLKKVHIEANKDAQIFTRSSYLYVQSPSQIKLYDKNSYKLLRKITLKKSDYVLTTKTHLYIKRNKKLFRYGLSLNKKEISRDKKWKGRLLAANDNLVVLQIDKNTLRAFDFNSGKKHAEFRLIDKGSQIYFKANGSELSFLDYRIDPNRAHDKHRIFFAKWNFKEDKKTSEGRFFNIFKGKSIAIKSAHLLNQCYLVVEALIDKKKTLLFLDAQEGRYLFSKNVRIFSFLSFFNNTFYLIEQNKEIADSHYQPEFFLKTYQLDGKQLKTIELQANPIAPVFKSKHKMLIALNKTLYLLNDSLAVSAPIKEKKEDLSFAKDWKEYQDGLAGYQIYLPAAWKLNSKQIRHYGKNTFSVPFTLYLKKEGQWHFRSSLHILVRPANGQTIEQLLQDVIKQRKKKNGHVEVLSKTKVKVGQHLGLSATYKFRNIHGVDERAKSLCVMSHGLAFEIRVRIRPEEFSALEKEIDYIFKTFIVRADLKKN